MSITVEQAMQLNVMKSAKVVTGKSGLDRIITRVSFVDSPISPDVIDKNIILQGDFFVSSLFAFKDSPERVQEIIEYFIYAKSSGLCIIDEFVSILPQSILDYANENSYPIIFIDKDVPYADIIKDIMEIMLQEKDNIILEMKINNLLELGDNSEEVVKEALTLNENFKRYAVVLNCKCPGMESHGFEVLKTRINSTPEWYCFKYKNNILIIITYDKILKNNINVKIDYVVEQIKQLCRNYMIGISNIHIQLGHLNKCIMEAMASCESQESCNNSIVYYKGLGIYKLLLPLKNKPEMKEFHDEIILPILEYDKSYNKNLLETAIYFVENDGDYRNTANSMFLHENTVRYRIGKIKEVLNMQNKNLKFFENLSIAIKIYKIYSEINRYIP